MLFQWLFCSLTEIDWQYQTWKWGIVFTDNVCYVLRYIIRTLAKVE